MKRGRFPQFIKRGSCVLMISRSPHKGYPVFTAARFDANGNIFASYLRTFSAHAT